MTQKKRAILFIISSFGRFPIQRRAILNFIITLILTTCGNRNKSKIITIIRILQSVSKRQRRLNLETIDSRCVFLLFLQASVKSKTCSHRVSTVSVIPSYYIRCPITLHTKKCHLLARAT